MLSLRSVTTLAFVLLVLDCTRAQYGGSSSGLLCTQGINYCQDTLTNPANNFDPSYAGQVQVIASNQLGTGLMLFSCGANGTIRFLNRCLGQCIHNGTGLSDYCNGNDNHKDCTAGLNYCADTLKEPASGFRVDYLRQVGAAVMSNPGPGPALFSCGNGGSITFIKKCPGIGCTNNTALGTSDECNTGPTYQCTQGLTYCQQTLVYPMMCRSETRSLVPRNTAECDRGTRPFCGFLATVGQPGKSKGYRNFDAKYNDLIPQLDAVAPQPYAPSLWLCGAGGSISLLQRCPGTQCSTNSFNDITLNDTCVPNPVQCTPGNVYCQDDLAGTGTNWNSSYIFMMEQLLTANFAYGHGLFMCNADGTLSLQKRCPGSCSSANNGTCNVDTHESLLIPAWGITTSLGIL